MVSDARDKSTGAQVQGDGEHETDEFSYTPVHVQGVLVMVFVPAEVRPEVRILGREFGDDVTLVTFLTIDANSSPIAVDEDGRLVGSRFLVADRKLSATLESPSVLVQANIDGFVMRISKGNQFRKTVGGIVLNGVCHVASIRLGNSSKFYTPTSGDCQRRWRCFLVNKICGTGMS